MAIRYNRLWKKLIDENMMKTDLRDKAGITTNALAKLGKNEHVNTQVLEKICNVLHCNIQDIAEFVPDEEREEKGVTPNDMRPGRHGRSIKGSLPPLRREIFHIAIL